MNTKFKKKEESRSFKLIITCEHASNKLPVEAKKLHIPQAVLESHRGYDIGALSVYKKIVKRLRPDFHCAAKYSRLFIDLNRSITNKNSFNEFWDAATSKGDVPKSLKDVAIDYHKKYREPIETFVTECLKNKTPIIHLAIHSFTPILNGEKRNTDVGILYDPSNPVERKLADTIINDIKKYAAQLRIRKNYPYQGKTDGLCTTLRKISTMAHSKEFYLYAGFEIEFNQNLFGKPQFIDYINRMT